MHIARIRGERKFSLDTECSKNASCKQKIMFHLAIYDKKSHNDIICLDSRSVARWKTKGLVEVETPVGNNLGPSHLCPSRSKPCIDARTAARKTKVLLTEMCYEHTCVSTERKGSISVTLKKEFLFSDGLWNLPFFAKWEIINATLINVSDLHILY